MNRGRPKKYGGFYKKISIRIPLEYSDILNNLRVLSLLTGKSINEVILDTLIDNFITLPDPLNNRKDANSNLKSVAKLEALKSQFRAYYVKYKWTLDYIKQLHEKKSNHFYQNQSDVDAKLDLMTLELEQLREKLCKVISQFDDFDNELQNAFNEILNPPPEVKDFWLKHLNKQS